MSFLVNEHYTDAGTDIFCGLCGNQIEGDADCPRRMIDVGPVCLHEVAVAFEQIPGGGPTDHQTNLYHGECVVASGGELTIPTR